MVTLKFGKHKGKGLKDVPVEYLQWITETSDVNDPKYGASNKFLVAACHDEINRRTDLLDGGGRPAKKEVPNIQLKSKGQLVGEVQALIEDLYKHAAKMKTIMEQLEDVDIQDLVSKHTPF